MANLNMNQLVKSYNSSNDEITCLITDLVKNEYTKGFKISFRYYNVSCENGGFETTLWIANCDIKLAKGFCCLKHEYEYFAKLVGATISSKKTNNKVSERYTYQNMKKILTNK